MLSMKARAPLAGIGAIGIGVAAYAFAEAHSYRVRTVDVPVLAPGSRPIRILHLSDLHLTHRQKRRQDWIRGLSKTAPDFVVATGDLLADRDGLGALLYALGPLMDRPGAFVFGSNDYYSPHLGNPLSYLVSPSSHQRKREPDLPTEQLRSLLIEHGWLDLNNQEATAAIKGTSIGLKGVDDPHIERDRYSDVAGPYPAEADLRVGVTHAPYRRVLDAMVEDQSDLVIAGHTHGGQVCVPGFGALTTNCDLDRRQAKGLSAYGSAYLHVSAGIGTNPYTPFRLACPPEATIMTLGPRRGDQTG